MPPLTELKMDGRGRALLEMARQMRIQYAGAVYHVMGRGNQGRPIYADDRDRKRWLETYRGPRKVTKWD